MRTLQVRNLPDDIYDKLSLLASKEHRSLAQQTIILLKECLASKENNQERRKAVLKYIQSYKTPGKIDHLDPVKLVREDRNR